MKHSSRFVATSVGTALALATIVSAATTIYMERCLAGVDEELRVLSEHALPALARVQVAQSRARSASTLAMGSLSAPDGAGKGAAVTALGETLTALRAVPPCDAKPSDLDAAEGRARNLLETFASAEPSAARLATVHDDLAALDGSLDAVANAEILHAREAVVRVQEMRRTTSILALLLVVGAIATAVISGLGAWVTVRRYSRFVERRADELEQFAGRIAHDVVSPLAGTKLAIGFSEKRVDDEDTKTMLRRGSEALTRAQKIVEALLAFARAGAQANPDDRANGKQVVLDVLEHCSREARRAGVMLRAARCEAVDVCCSPGVLTSILSNLGANAIKYMGSSKERIVTFSNYLDGHGVRFEVQDTGPGIDTDTERDIFLPHVRGSNASEANGIGLGLATVKRLVEAHGGRVGFHSKLGHGTTFWVELHAASDQSFRRKKSLSILPKPKARLAPSGRIR
jgi:signal transduction histidine kinase